MQASTSLEIVDEPAAIDVEDISGVMPRSIACEVRSGTLQVFRAAGVAQRGAACDHGFEGVIQFVYARPANEPGGDHIDTYRVGSEFERKAAHH